VVLELLVLTETLVLVVRLEQLADLDPLVLLVLLDLLA